MNDVMLMVNYESLGNLLQQIAAAAEVQTAEKLREQVGDFGELVYAGMDWVDPKLANRSMELMATEVMPRVNAAIAAGGAVKKVA